MASSGIAGTWSLMPIPHNWPLQADGHLGRSAPSCVRR
jgi:hypothetical protein